MKVRAHVFISGQVQGVFFRSEITRRAKSRDVHGWVRNLPDGEVEAVFEGEESDVRELVAFCEVGPSGAVVTDIRVAWETFRGEFVDFEVRYY